MNCQEFNNVLGEYLDESLGATTQDATRRHLQECVECRRAVEGHTIVGESIRRGLDRASAQVSLRPGMARDILKALEAEPAAANGWVRAWRRFVPVHFRPIAAFAVVLGLLLLVSGLFYRLMNHGSSNGAAFDDYVVDVPMKTETHVFERDGDVVVDAMMPQASVGYARVANKK
jgi:hypothetical protein